MNVSLISCKIEWLAQMVSVISKVVVFRGFKDSVTVNNILLWFMSSKEYDNKWGWSIAQVFVVGFTDMFLL